MRGDPTERRAGGGLIWTTSGFVVRKSANIKPSIARPPIEGRARPVKWPNIARCVPGGRAGGRPGDHPRAQLRRLILTQRRRRRRRGCAEEEGKKDKKPRRAVDRSNADTLPRGPDGRTDGEESDAWMRLRACTRQAQYTGERRNY